MRSEDLPAAIGSKRPVKLNLMQPAGASGRLMLESKEDIRKRLGRSPGKGDAVVMAWSEARPQCTGPQQRNQLIGRIDQRTRKLGWASIGTGHHRIGGL
jgi:hypothetical protein